MGTCKECQRPIAAEWVICAWCGSQQMRHAPASDGFGRIASIANMVLAFQAVALTGGTIALAVLWAMRGWSVEGGQTLGIIWLGVMMALGLMAWLSVTLSSRSGTDSTTPQQHVY